MSSPLPPQPFRFLDLPPEVRHYIYDLVLCSWDTDHDPVSDVSVKLSRRRLHHRTAGLLRANKEVNVEASDYMLKRNQLVRVTCCGFDFEKLFWTKGVPVVTADSRRVSHYNGYVMHVLLSRPWGCPRLQSSDYEMAVLLSDMMLFCEKLDVENARVDQYSRSSDYTSIRIKIQFRDELSTLYTRKIQQHLLKPITTHIRGIYEFKVLGPVDPGLRQAAADEVAKPRWTDCQSLLREIEDYLSTGELQWQQRSYDEAAESWAHGICTLERARWSSSWLALLASGGSDFTRKVTERYYSLNLMHVRFLLLDMIGEPAGGLLMQRNGKLALKYLEKCGDASALFALDGHTMWPPNRWQASMMLYLRARCTRLTHDYENMFNAGNLIQVAKSREPNNLAIAEEAIAVLSWVWSNEQAWLSFHIRRAKEACKVMAERAAKMMNETEKMIDVMSAHAPRESAESTRIELANESV